MPTASRKIETVEAEYVRVETPGIHDRDAKYIRLQHLHRALESIFCPFISGNVTEVSGNYLQPNWTGVRESVYYCYHVRQTKDVLSIFP